MQVLAGELALQKGGVPNCNDLIKDILCSYSGLCINQDVLILACMTVLAGKIKLCECSCKYGMYSTVPRPPA